MSDPAGHRKITRVRRRRYPKRAPEAGAQVRDPTSEPRFYPGDISNLNRTSTSDDTSLSPPRTLKRAKFDNLALVPASLLTYKATWQQLANELPVGSTLITLPASASPRSEALERIKASFEATGRSVKILPASEITESRQLRLLVG